MTVVYQKKGLIPAQRMVVVPWNDFAVTETFHTGNDASGFGGENVSAFNASISSPQALYLDVKGNIYFVDNYRRIRNTVTVYNKKHTTMTQDILQAAKIITTSENRTTTMSYDRHTLLTQSLNVPGFYDTNYTYDSKGRLISVNMGRRQTTYGYNDRGLIESITGPSTHTAFFNYDAVGRPPDIVICMTKTAG